MKKIALIMAGGVGLRAGKELPKQFHKLLGIPMLWWSVKAFYDQDPKTHIIIVLHPDFFNLYEEYRLILPKEIRDIPVQIIAGGKNRGESVANGIKDLPEDELSIIAVHDAARPLVTLEIISEGWENAIQNKCAVPVVPVTDSLRKITGQKSKAVDRNSFFAVQTPQVFRSDILKRAYRLEDRSEFTDDASRVEALGEKITLFRGDTRNFKVTNPIDFAIAQTLLNQTS